MNSSQRESSKLPAGMLAGESAGAQGNNRLCISYLRCAGERGEQLVGQFSVVLMDGQRKP